MTNEEIMMEDEKLIENAFQELLNNYINSNHRRKIELITRAYQFAKEAHKGARRRSGEPYILHPIAVAMVVSKEMGLGSTSICASLLHDVVEDTEYTIEDIKALFGEKIAQIVEGLTKISSGMFGPDVSAQAENFRKLLLTMSEDIRVILIKIADRLHNMRTLSSMAPAKQYKITGETMYIYAPLAHRLGLFAIKTELEELSFKYEHPETYKNLKDKILATDSERNIIYTRFAEPLREVLDKMDIEYEMIYRVKSLYSIWKKMEAKGIEFEEVYDLFAVRIIFEITPYIDEKKKCWDIYSAITDLYKLRPDRIRDWVSHPKANGYQALHLTVMGPDGRWIEVQIRSRRMDEIAEKGFAAHWKYKDQQVEEDNELDKWIKTIQEILADPNPNAIDFLDTVKMNLFSSEIFVFTPRGDIKTLPQGATALDFAYNIHSRVGDQCIGAKVNHRLVPLSYPLNSGDQVEIITSQTQTPQSEWLTFVVTAKARAKIEASLKREKRSKIEEGKSKLDKLFHDEEIDNDTFVKILNHYKIEKKDDLFYLLGTDEIILPEDSSFFNKVKNNDEKQGNPFIRYVKQAVNAVKKNATNESASDVSKDSESVNDEVIDTKKVYPLRQEFGKRNFLIPNCCNPLPGDDVFGYINDANKVEVHKRSCSTGQKLKANYGQRIVAVSWGDYKQYLTEASINFSGIDKKGILNIILSKIVDETIDVTIKNVNVNSNDGIFDGIIKLSVHSLEDINQLCSKIAKVDGVTTVHRSL